MFKTQSTKVHEEIPCEESQEVNYIFWVQYLLYTWCLCEQKADLTGLRDGGNKDILNEKHKPNNGCTEGAQCKCCILSSMCVRQFQGTPLSKIKPVWKREAENGMSNIQSKVKHAACQRTLKWKQIANEVKNQHKKRQAVQINEGGIPAVRLQQRHAYLFRSEPRLGKFLILNLSIHLVTLLTFLNKPKQSSCIPPSTLIIWDTHSHSCSTWHSFSQKEARMKKQSDCY